MLSSITPLGERSRNSRWSRTVAGYVIGSVLSAVLVGSLLGALGSLLSDSFRSSPPVLAALAATFVLGYAVDRRAQGDGVPSWRRQVDREWIGRYRGWVTGLGFGLQLGLGFVTIITSTTTYAVFLAQALTGRWWAGALIGLVFGLVRALPLVLVRGAHSPRHLHEIFAQVDTWEAPAARLSRTSLLAAALTCAVSAVL